MNQAVSFGLLGTGGILLTKALTGSTFRDVVRGHPGHIPTSGTKLTVAGTGSSVGQAITAAAGAAGAPPSGPQKQQVQQVAAQYGLSPQTLWGVYGTESSFGTDLSTSSAGAEGPFQFLPSTWATYGGGGNIMNFSDSLVAAAKLLKGLGANSDPSSSATAAALNHYSGGGGGDYISKVLHFGGEF